MSSNEEQIQYWNENGPKWVQLQDDLDKTIGPIGDHMIELAAAAPGERVLDVGCGCGATSLSLARRVAPSGKVTGVDISVPMLARARERVAEEAIDNIEFLEADAQVHAFEAAQTDLITSRFGIMFFADPVAAFRNLHGALKPEGRTAFVCWQPLGENPWMRIPVMAAASQLAELPPPPDPNAPGPFALGDPDRVRSILADAGFQKVEVDAHEAELTLGGSGSFEDSVDFILRMGPTGRMLAEVGQDVADRAREAVAKAVEPYATPSGIQMSYATWLVRALHG